MTTTPAPDTIDRGDEPPTSSPATTLQPEPERTPAPARRAFRLPVAPGASSSLVRIAEGTPSVRVDLIQPEPLNDDEEDDEPPEPEEVKTAYVKPDNERLVDLVVPHASSSKSVLLELVVDVSGKVFIDARLDSDPQVVASAAIGT